MIPPMSGIQAIAAATFEGKPLDVDFGPVTGPVTGGGGGGGGAGIGSSGGRIGSWSGMPYVHKITISLSRNYGTARIRPQPNLRRDTPFSLSFSSEQKYREVQIENFNRQKFPPRLYVNLIARCDRSNHHPDCDGVSRFHKCFGTRKSHKRSE